MGVCGVVKKIQLQVIAGKVWRKGDELKKLKSELVALDRKIRWSLRPNRRKRQAISSNYRRIYGTIGQFL